VIKHLKITVNLKNIKAVSINLIKSAFVQAINLHRDTAGDIGPIRRRRQHYQGDGKYLQ